MYRGGGQRVPLYIWPTFPAMSCCDLHGFHATCNWPNMEILTSFVPLSCDNL